MKKKGSSFVLVIIIMTMLSFIYLISYSFSRVEKDITISFLENSNMYYLCKSGLEKSLDIINNIASKNINTSEEIIFNEIKNLNIKDSFYYKVNNLSDKYNGEFHLYNNSFYKDKLALNLASKINTELNEKYKISYNTYGLTYTNIFEEEKYITEIIIKRIGTNFSVESKVINQNKNTSLEMSGEIKFGKNNTEEIFIENIIPINLSKVFDYNFLGKKIFIENEEIILEDNNFLFELENIFNNINNLEENIYSKENPIIIINDKLDLNISEIQNAIIINKSKEDLNIFSNSENIFKGIIISNGNIFLKNIKMEGNIFSNENIYFENSNIIVSKDIFNININNNILRRNIFDAFNITSFNKISSTGQIKKNIFINNSKLEIKILKVENKNQYYLYNDKIN